jgi:protein O-GlcNAc transferase
MTDASLLQLTPTLTLDEALQQAVAGHRAGQLQEAERLYRAILQAEPNHAEANHNLGVLAVQVKQPVASLPHFKAALEANPNQGQYWLSYIDALIQTGKTDVARQALERGRRQGLQGDSLEVLAGRLGPSPQEINELVALFNQGSYAEAELLARSLIERFPQHGFVWKVLGAVLQQQGQVDGALLAKQKAAELLPRDAEVHYNLGITLAALGRLAEAEASSAGR